VASVPSSGRKNLWAHHMVGNVSHSLASYLISFILILQTYSYTAATWSDDISQAAAAGFDGFALNHGSSDWQFDRMADAYNVASAQGSFKLFL
jgi:glucan endo-1,3-alpha-glucosidase